MGDNARDTISRLIFLVVIGIILFLSTYPVLFSFFSSCKPSMEMFDLPPRVLPKNWTLVAYDNLFSNVKYLKFFRNSCIISASSTIICVILATLSAYGFSRFYVPAKRSVMVGILLLQMFPGVILMTPYYRIAQDIGIYNTYIVLILINSAFVLPLAIWLLKNFFDTIPVSLEESALVDGATRVQAIIHIIAPLMRPGMIAVAIMSFLKAWNEFMFALILTTGPSRSPISFGLAQLFTQYNVARNTVMAVTMLSVVPLFMIFVFLQRHLVRGIMGGAEK